MASNHTPTYGLNQWSLEDSVLMEEFNTDNRNIEQALLELKAALPKFQTGSYVGAGTFGADNPTTLTFDFEPQLVIIMPEAESVGGHQCLSSGESASPLIALRGATTFSMSYDSGLYNSTEYGSALINLFWEGNTLRWYGNESNASLQYNATNLTYRYLAIG